ncbi:MAG: hypothetical protein LBF27_14225 [Sphingobacterium sp.]|jgi:uncharacterized protein YggL (DUF469 family)|nr:hypothetical protein [Sphingobacterium sp.]
MKHLSRQELIDLVKRISNAEGTTEQEDDDMLDLFLENVPDPNAADYIFSKEYEGLSAEEIVDRALAYKPFIM